MKRIYQSLSILILLAGLLAGCRFGQRGNQLPTDTPAAQPTVPPNLTMPPPETPQLQPTFAPTATAVLTPTTAPTATVALIHNQTASIMAANVNLRQGPGTLFQIMAQLAEGAKVTVIGKAKGDDWLYIDTGKRQGWASAAFVTLQNPIATVPETQVTGAVVLHGQVLDKAGKPVDRIEFAAFQGKEESKPPDTRAHSLADGNFYLYLPAGAHGTWRVNLTAIDCKSRIVDADCKFSGAFAPRFVDVDVPYDKTIEITYLTE